LPNNTNKTSPFPPLFSPLIPYRYCGRMISMKKVLLVIILTLFVASKIIDLVLNFKKNVNFSEAVLMPTIENF